MEERDDAQLLDGESSADVRDPRVVQRWITVYSELVHYKELLLPVTSMWAAAISPEAEREMARILHHRLLGHRLAQYRRRLVHWQRAAAGPGSAADLGNRSAAGGPATSREGSRRR
jgi:hypothetical protein